ncbi:MAG: serine/threonine-protein phosphatase, partial [Deltaproteobacteria bacterium]|nr:serine/threonine-protein phosphatase [Deltaproteobacteria bacterium]
MFIDVACVQERKFGQNALGDYFASKRLADEGRVLSVLSDGLGSGIKASILARMTATMLLGFTEAHMDPGRAAAT